MEIKKVQDLLEKFYEGKSSLEDESVLRSFFLNEEVPEELESDRLYFATMETEKKNLQPDGDLTSDILQAINDSEQSKQGKRSFITRLYPWIGAAAGLLLVLSTYFFLSLQRPKDTFDDPKLAYIEAQKVLLYVSNKLSEGTKPLYIIQETNKKTAPLRNITALDRVVNDMQLISNASGQMSRLQALEPLQDPKTIISTYIKK